jgi:hypothetical protein
MVAKDSSAGTVIALTVLTEVAGQPGVKLVGRLPKELQVPLPYSKDAPCRSARLRLQRHATALPSPAMNSRRRIRDLPG